ncbi:hypothetical protein ACS0TY_024368 [Phlomoides rotata]
MAVGHGLRSRVRDSFSSPFRKKGTTHLSTYLRIYKIGDYVDVKVNGSIHQGMPNKFYHRQTNLVWNVTKRVVGVELNKVKKNDLLKTEAKKEGKIISTKRQPEGPNPGFMVEGAIL